MEAGISYEMSVNYQTTQRYKPQYNLLHTHRHKNLKSHIRSNISSLSVKRVTTSGDVNRILYLQSLAKYAAVQWPFCFNFTINSESLRHFEINTNNFHRIIIYSYIRIQVGLIYIQTLRITMCVSS